MSNETNEILTIAGKRVRVAYTGAANHCNRCCIKGARCRVRLEPCRKYNDPNSPLAAIFVPAKEIGEEYCKQNCKGFQETGRCFSDGECEAKRNACKPMVLEKWGVVLDVNTKICNKMKTLMIGDYCQSISDEIIGKVSELEKDGFRVETEDGATYHGFNVIPVPIDAVWIEKAKRECEKHGIILDWSRKHKLKVSCIETMANSEKKIQISFFYPKPKFVHELQKILRDFDEMEI